MFMDDDVVVGREERGLISVLTMEYRPYNLLGPTLIGAIAAEVTAAQEAGSRAIVLRSGLRHFSAGADVNLFDARIEQEGRREAAISGVDFLKLLELLPIPIVASVHGVCLGGGFELALACDYIVAASSAKIGSVEVALGLHPLLGGIQRQVERAGAMHAKEIAMLGRRYVGALGSRQPRGRRRRAGVCDLHDRRGIGARADSRPHRNEASCAHCRQ
jgi:enoyl-CoA hydratase/carnithine racemase